MQKEVPVPVKKMNISAFNKGNAHNNSFRMNNSIDIGSEPFYTAYTPQNGMATSNVHAYHSTSLSGHNSGNFNPIH